MTSPRFVDPPAAFPGLFEAGSGANYLFVARWISSSEMISRIGQSDQLGRSLVSPHRYKLQPGAIKGTVKFVACRMFSHFAKPK